MNPDHPLPSAGGSYLRDPDTGELTLIVVPDQDYPEIPPAVAERLEVPVEPAIDEADPVPAKGRKPAKEA